MKRLCLLALPFLASACAIGQSDFSCRGYPAGVSCMSAVEVYEATNDKSSLSAPQEPAAKAATSAPRTVQFGGYSPPPDRPVPLRADPVIMRIWFKDWQDEYGNLNGSSYVFAEIEKRRWNVGETPAATSRALFPVASTANAASNAAYMSQAPGQRPDTIPPPSATVGGESRDSTSKMTRRGPQARPGQSVPPRSGSIVE